jgi:hypothetical protein
MIAPRFWAFYPIRKIRLATGSENQKTSWLAGWSKQKGGTHVRKCDRHVERYRLGCKRPKIIGRLPLALFQLDDFGIHKNEQFIVVRILQITLEQPAQNRNLVQSRKRIFFLGRC